LKQAGFTLLEVMIALAMGLFLLLGIFDVFDAARQSYRYIQGLALIQENGQLVSYLLNRELSQVGYIGCRKLSSSFSIQSHDKTSINSAMLIHGYNHQNLPASEKFIVQKMTPDSSVIAIQFMDADTASLMKSVEGNVSWLSVSAEPTFDVGDEVMISDCMHADVVSITGRDGQELETNVELHNYEAGAQVGEWRNEWFYVGQTDRKNNVGQAVMALYVHQPNGRDEELVDNVVNMHVQYGYVLGTGELKFIPALQVTDWAAVKAVRVILLLSSGEQVLSRPQMVKFDGYNWQPPDRQLYKQWEVVVALLNR
jgi:type IV pilus assembly protein PilW